MDVQTILKIAISYSDHIGLRLSSLGAYSVNDGKFFDRLQGGGSCTLKTAKRFLSYLNDNWPADLEWPADVPRPPTCKKEVA